MVVRVADHDYFALLRYLTLPAVPAYVTYLTLELPFLHLYLTTLPTRAADAKELSLN